MSGSNINSVFYASSYHPIQAGSIDGTDILPHDNAVYRAHLCSSAGLCLYLLLLLIFTSTPLFLAISNFHPPSSKFPFADDPFGDPKVIGDPFCTVFVGRLSHLTTEHTLSKAMSKYGRVKNLRLVRHIVTGASRGYAFVEYETEREMLRAYKDAHHSIIDDCEIIVDYNRQQLMPGWIPRRLGGGLGGKKESGQLRFGGRERPFRAPLRPIPFDDLKRLGIPPPPEGRYMSRYQVPSPPRRERSLVEREEGSRRRRSMERERHARKSSSVDREERSRKRRSSSSMDREEHSQRTSVEKKEEQHYTERTSRDRDNRSYSRKHVEREEQHYDKRVHSHKKSYKDRDPHRSHKRQK